MWKILLVFMGKRKCDYIRTVKLNGKVFVIEIKEFVSADEELSKWKNALDRSRTLN